MSNEEACKACPFCGSEDVSEGEVLTDTPSGGTVTQSMCKGCGALGPEAKLPPGDVDFGDVRATAAWNRRAAPPVAAPGASIDSPEFARLLLAWHDARISSPNGTDVSQQANAIIAFADAHAEQRYEAGHLTGYTKAHEEAWTGHEATLKRAEAAEASLARLVEGVVSENDTVNLPKSEPEAVIMVLLGTSWLKEFAPERLKPAKADNPVVPTRPGITIDHKTFHDMMENYRAAVSEGTAHHTYRVTVEFVDLYAAQQREAGYHAGFMDASKPQPDNGG